MNNTDLKVALEKYNPKTYYDKGVKEYALEILSKNMFKNKKYDWYDESGISIGFDNAEDVYNRIYSPKKAQKMLANFSDEEWDDDMDSIEDDYINIQAKALEDAEKLLMRLEKQANKKTIKFKQPKMTNNQLQKMSRGI